MTQLQDEPGERRWLFAFLVTACLSIGPWWLVKRDIWDGIIGSYGIATGDLSGIYDWLVLGNWGLMYGIFWGLSWLASHTVLETWVAVKLLLTFSVLGIAWEARRLAIDLLGMTGPQAWAVSLLALSFPCWYLLYGSTFVYVVFIWWGFLGHRLLHAPPDGTRWHGLKLCLGYLLMLTSFQVNSNFVMMCALEAARWLSRKPTARWNYRRSMLICATAVVVYLLLRFVFTTTGNYAGYNNVIWPTSLAGAVAWLRAILMFATWIALLAGPACLVWLLARWLNARQAAGKAEGKPMPMPIPANAQGVRLPASQKWTLALLCMGALFAYIAVGKGTPLFVINLSPEFLGSGTHLGNQTSHWFYTPVDGWSARHAFLLSVPASLISIWLILRALGRIQSQATANTLWITGVLVGVFVQLAWQWHGHGAKQLRIAQETAIVGALQAQAKPAGGLVDIKINTALPWSLWTYEANYLTWLAYGQTQWATSVYTPGTGFVKTALQDRKHLIEGSGPMQGHSRTYALMTDFRPSSCQTEFVIQVPDTLHPLSWAVALVQGKALPSATVLSRSETCTPTKL